jgi:hypothetical protein
MLLNQRLFGKLQLRLRRREVLTQEIGLRVDRINLVIRHSHYIKVITS